MGLNQALVVHLRVELCQIRGPIIKKHPNAVFFVEKIRILWYNIRVSWTTFGRLFLLPATAGVFLFNQKELL